MKNSFTTCTVLVGLIAFPAPFSATFAADYAAKPILLAEMKPMPPAGVMPGGMADDKMGAMSKPAMPGGMEGDKMKPPMAGGMTDEKGKPAMADAMKGMMGMMGKGMPPAAGAAPASVMQPPPAVPLDHVEGRIAFMKAELAITDAQAPGWAEFAAALRTSRTHLDESRAALVISQNGPATSPARLEAYEQHLSARLASLHDARESYQRLYATLTPDQQKNADEMVSPLLASF